MFTKLKQKLIRIVDNHTGYDKRVLLKTFRLPNGLVETFFVDQDKDSCQVFALTANNEVAVVVQFRSGNEQENIELPGGGVDAGENLLRAAERELREETGLTGKVVHLASPHYSPYSTGRRHMFMATDCKRTHHLDLDPNEFLKVKFIPLAEFREMMRKGAVRGFDGAYLALDKLGML